jgi:uracil-DNA glycosylase family 4
MADSLCAVAREIASCRRCPRLVEWRERSAADPPRRYRAKYWARPLPGFGDPKARIVIVGLALAAHGGNRTGRIFTGDRSGDWLFAALHRAGLANQPTSVSINDGLRLRDAYINAVNRCPPPQNRPTSEERDNCLPYLVRELRLLRAGRVIVLLGSFAWTGTCWLWRSWARSCRARDRVSGMVRRPRSGRASAPGPWWAVFTRASRTRSPGGSQSR